MTLQQDAFLPTILAVAAAAACIGYYVGKSAGQHQTDVIPDPHDKKSSSPIVADGSDDGGGGDDDSDEGEDINKFINTSDDCKMVLVVRTDLGMTKGKMAAQCGHATLMCYKAALRHAPNLVRRWETRGQTKVAVQVGGGEDELLVLQAHAMSLGVVAKIVHDAGRTQIAAGSATALGLGPAPRCIVDQISGHLKLL